MLDLKTKARAESCWKGPDNAFAHTLVAADPGAGFLRAMALFCDHVSQLPSHAYSEVSPIEFNAT